MEEAKKIYAYKYVTCSMNNNEWWNIMLKNYVLLLLIMISFFGCVSASKSKAIFLGEVTPLVNPIPVEYKPFEGRFGRGVSICIAIDG